MNGILAPSRLRRLLCATYLGQVTRVYNKRPYNKTVLVSFSKNNCNFTMYNNTYQCT